MGPPKHPAQGNRCILICAPLQPACCVHLLQQLRLTSISAPCLLQRWSDTDIDMLMDMLTTPSAGSLQDSQVCYAVATWVLLCSPSCADDAAGAAVTCLTSVHGHMASRCLEAAQEALLPQCSMSSSPVPDVFELCQPSGPSRASFASTLQPVPCKLASWGRSSARPLVGAQAPAHRMASSCPVTVLQPPATSHRLHTYD